ncbi:MAG: phosphatidylserine decarboxylase related protein [Bacteroidetes bacterium]|uniref:phosphatidylserine decarboxylase family protein n=1 Tax=Chitinophaga TaxID=79328 RepID=UPI0009C5150B|nr:MULTISPECIES: phosphatidylserine decarboxylase family protein [Chitinophaga]MBP1652087.1 phosphatidylserine decarboxylase related protein [Bacteroidota bacterium]OMP79827.1 phosphatidylserine decarboxylase [[Flexibacter] sp. ATCC 35208]WPQ64158.1 phosphatidylserine decarboxylase family protein [Chitinophaga sancti]WPV68609.1 phosphatidylserine decarboxylase family protein [Chitinophaga sp. LS1]
MKIHREGLASILIAFVVLALISGAVIYFLPGMPLVGNIVAAFSVVLFLFIVSFFRIPAREMKLGESLVMAPCDGKVVVIEETYEPEYFKDKRLQVSIFMSPANVHVNRNPISGEVKLSQYHSGKYLVAWHPKSSTENERHTVVIGNGKADILVRQIAGALARRIVNYLKPGMQVTQNEELGFIKFGSRVDLYLPIGTKVDVQLEQVVRSGQTVIATL